MPDPVTAPASPEALTGEALDRIEAHAAAQGDMRAVHADVVALCREVRRLRAALERCDELFHEIRCDFTDPRSECREGMAIVSAALAPVATGPGEP